MIFSLCIVVSMYFRLFYISFLSLSCKNNVCNRLIFKVAFYIFTAVYTEFRQVKYVYIFKGDLKMVTI